MRLPLLLLVLLATLTGCGSDYGTVDDVITETRSAVGGDAVEDRRTVDCLEEDGGQRVAASIGFPDVADIDAAVDAIDTAWSAAWPDDTVRESAGRVVVMTSSGVVAATVTNDPDGELRVDLVGPCESP